MATKLYVGNLTYEVTEDRLKKLFSEVGTVVSVNLITDRHSGRSKGFAFVEMDSNADAKAAIEKLNSTDLDGRKLNVNVAEPRQERPGGERGFGGGGYRSKRF